MSAPPKPATRPNHDRHPVARSPTARRATSIGLRWGGWIALALSVAAYVIVSVHLHQPFHHGGHALRYFDLAVYRGGGERLIHGVGLYGRPILLHLGFTYPPFAALLFAPLAWFRLAFDERAVTAINVVLLVWLLRRTLLIGPRRASGPPAIGQARTWSFAAVLAAAALWLEPIVVTLGYGQIDLLIAALVVFDLSRPDSARTKGAAIGLAAAIKLTPLLFIVYLLLSGRRRAAALAAAEFAGSIALAFAVTPADASRFWGGRFLDASHVGKAAVVSNQSLRGLIARLGADPKGGGLTVAVVIVALLGLALAVGAARRGDEAAGFSLAGLCTLLVSPISWTHEWTLAVPALLLLARRAYTRRSWPLAIGAGALILLGYSYLPEIKERTLPGQPALHHGPATLLTSDPYVLAGLLTLAVAATVAARATLRDRAGRRRVAVASATVAEVGQRPQRDVQRRETRRV